MNITKGQRKILIILSAIIVLFVIFWVVVYMPAKNSVRLLKIKLQDAEGKIDSIKVIIGKGKSIEEGFAILRDRLVELDNKFPCNEQETLRNISNIAYKSGLNIASIKPQPKTPFLDKNEDIAKIESKVCHKISISMVVYSTYRKLGEFLEALSKDLPSLLTVEKLNVVKEPKGDELKTEIDLTMYLLVDEGK